MSEQRNFILTCRQEHDENGAPEEFTTDLYDLVDVDDLSYLSSDGLPQIGTRVAPGMLLVGKVGAKKSDERSKWNELQLLTANCQELQNYWRSRIYDGSLYAPEGCTGAVVAAFFEPVGDRVQAVVEIEYEDALSDEP